MSQLLCLCLLRYDNGEKEHCLEMWDRDGKVGRTISRICSSPCFAGPCMERHSVLLRDLLRLSGVKSCTTSVLSSNYWALLTKSSSATTSLNIISGSCATAVTTFSSVQCMYRLLNKRPQLPYLSTAQ